MAQKTAEPSSQGPAPGRQLAARAQDLHPVLRLQRAVGNQAVLGLLRGGVLQRKLAIGAPGDVYELEAERVSAEVTRTASGPVVHRRCACGGILGPEGECAACRAKRLAAHHGGAFMGLVQRASLASAPGHAATTPIGRWAPGRAEPAQDVTSVVQDVITSRGQSLDPIARSLVENRFVSGDPDVDPTLSRVRIHADTPASESARALGARAYTVGPHIVFGAGEYNPNTLPGIGLLAHELVHVLQQSRLSDAQAHPVQMQPAGVLTEPHRPGGPSLRAAPPADGELVSGFPVSRRYCQCREQIPGQIKERVDKRIDAYRSCGGQAGTTTLEALNRCVSAKLIGPGKPVVPPAARADPETSRFEIPTEAEKQLRARLLPESEGDPCRPLWDWGVRVHEQRHIEQFEEVAAGLGPAFLAEFRKLQGDSERMRKLRARFPTETATYEAQAVRQDVPRRVQVEIEAYQSMRPFFVRVQSVLDRLCRVPQPRVRVQIP